MTHLMFWLLYVRAERLGQQFFAELWWLLLHRR